MCRFIISYYQMEVVHNACLSLTGHNLFLQMEERKRLEKEHKIMVEEEMEKAKLDMENELAEIQVRPLI